MPQRTVVQSLTYQLSGNGIQPITQVVLITGSPTSTSAFFAGLPAGPGYRIAISATCADAMTTCSASATAEVLAGTTTNLFLSLQCQTPPDGNAVVTATVVSCPQISSFAVAPAATSVGGEIEVWAQAFAPGGTAPSFSWAASTGTFSAAAAPSSSFTCLTAGPASITLTVSSGSCSDDQTVTVMCIAPAP